jgi:hypothetical protein
MAQPQPQPQPNVKNRSQTSHSKFEVSHTRRAGIVLVFCSRPVKANEEQGLVLAPAKRRPPYFGRRVLRVQD